MRKIIILGCLAIMTQVARSQTNVFPSDGNAGIGTTTPSAKLAFGIGDIYGEIGRIGFDVAGYQRAYISANRHTAVGQLTDLTLGTMGADRMVIKYDGRVGVGTANPATNFHVMGYMTLENPDGPAAIFTGTGTAELNKYLTLLNSAGLTSASGLKAGGILVADDYTYANPGKNDLTVKGAISVGTTAAPGGYKLAINGKAIVEEVKVKLQASGWPDYVFKPSYNLMPLTQVESFIKQNGHLPDVPTAKEVAEKGIEVGASQAVLLKKIEELTLHLIEMEKNMREEHARNQKFAAEIKEFKSKILHAN